MKKRLIPAAIVGIVILFVMLYCSNARARSAIELYSHFQKLIDESDYESAFLLVDEKYRVNHSVEQFKTHFRHLIGYRVRKKEAFVLPWSHQTFAIVHSDYEGNYRIRLAMENGIWRIKAPPSPAFDF